MEEPRGNKAEPLSRAPSPPEGVKPLRPEDVVIEEMDPEIKGIIITGARRKPKSKPEPPK